MLPIHGWINALKQSPEENHSPHLLIQCSRSHLRGVGRLPFPWAKNSSCIPCPGASPRLCGWPRSGSDLNQLSSSGTKKCCGNTLPLQAEASGEDRTEGGALMSRGGKGMKRWTPVSPSLRALTASLPRNISRRDVLMPQEPPGGNGGGFSILSNCAGSQRGED